MLFALSSSLIPHPSSPVLLRCYGASGDVAYAAACSAYASARVLAEAAHAASQLAPGADWSASCHQSSEAAASAPGRPPGFAESSAYAAMTVMPRFAPQAPVTLRHVEYLPVLILLLTRSRYACARDHVRKSE